ncbi:MAG: glutamate-5-semialdehyde dehydrogenase [Actinomycetota bacterium]|nr:glutamate-5-semialdehyde dehydrogenase [Actinomycetota bacterium]
MAVTTRSVDEICLAAKRASRRLSALDAAARNAALEAIAEALQTHSPEVLDANALDVDAGRAAGFDAALLDRLALNPARIRAMADGVRAVAALPDPVGEVIEGFRLPNGLDVRKVRVPLGVVAIVYEARPNVTIDCSALALKSGNAIVLRGSSAAAHSNAVLASIAIHAAAQAGIPEDAIGLLEGGDREELSELATQDGLVDLVIPRGGEGLKAALKAVATVPVIYAASGNCHVYVDAEADLEAAEAIVLNAKLQRPGVCNAVETLLVHRDVAAAFLPRILGVLGENGVALRVDPRAKALAGAHAPSLSDAVADDWDTEYHALILAVGVVDSTAAAIEHINTHGSGHSEAIVTTSLGDAEAFERGVDAACVYVNASTRFTDGAEFGMGAEIGNSTQKLHARGPIGVRELCSYKYVVQGSGQVRP